MIQLTSTPRGVINSTLGIALFHILCWVWNLAIENQTRDTIRSVASVLHSDEGLNILSIPERIWHSLKMITSDADLLNPEIRLDLERYFTCRFTNDVITSRGVAPAKFEFDPSFSTHYLF